MDIGPTRLVVHAGVAPVPRPILGTSTPSSSSTRSLAGAPSTDTLLLKTSHPVTPELNSSSVVSGRPPSMHRGLGDGLGGAGPEPASRGLDLSHDTFGVNLPLFEPLPPPRNLFSSVPSSDEGSWPATPMTTHLHSEWLVPEHMTTSNIMYNAPDSEIILPSHTTLALSREALLSLANHHQALANAAFAAAMEVAPPIAHPLNDDSLETVNVSRDDPSVASGNPDIGCNNVEPFEIGPEIPIILATKNPPHRVHLEELGFGFSLESAEAVWAMSCEALTMLAENYHQTLITTCDDLSTHVGTGYSGDHDASNCGTVLPFPSMFAREDSSQAEDTSRWGALNIAGRTPLDVDALSVPDCLGMIESIGKLTGSHDCSNAWVIGVRTVARLANSKSRQAVPKCMPSQMRGSKESGRTTVEIISGFQNKTSEWRQQIGTTPSKKVDCMVEDNTTPAIHRITVDSTSFGTKVPLARIVPIESEKFVPCDATCSMVAFPSDQSEYLSIWYCQSEGKDEMSTRDGPTAEVAHRPMNFLGIPSLKLNEPGLAGFQVMEPGSMQDRDPWLCLWCSEPLASTLGVSRVGNLVLAISALHILLLTETRRFAFGPGAPVARLISGEADASHGTVRLVPNEISSRGGAIIAHNSRPALTVQLALRMSMFQFSSILDASLSENWNFMRRISAYSSFDEPTCLGGNYPRLVSGIILVGLLCGYLGAQNFALSDDSFRLLPVDDPASGISGARKRLMLKRPAIWVLISARVDIYSPNSWENNRCIICPVYAGDFAFDSELRLRPLRSWTVGQSPFKDTARLRCVLAMSAATFLASHGYIQALDPTSNLRVELRDKYSRPSAPAVPSLTPKAHDVLGFGGIVMPAPFLLYDFLGNCIASSAQLHHKSRRLLIPDDDCLDDFRVCILGNGAQFLVQHAFGLPGLDHFDPNSCKVEFTSVMDIALVSAFYLLESGDDPRTPSTTQWLNDEAEFDSRATVNGDDHRNFLSPEVFQNNMEGDYLLELSQERNWHSLSINRYSCSHVLRSKHLSVDGTSKLRLAHSYIQVRDAARIGALGNTRHHIMYSPPHNFVYSTVDFIPNASRSVGVLMRHLELLTRKPHRRIRNCLKDSNNLFLECEQGSPIFPEISMKGTFDREGAFALIGSRVHAWNFHYTTVFLMELRISIVQPFTYNITAILGTEKTCTETANTFAVASGTAENDIISSYFSDCNHSTHGAPQGYTVASLIPEPRILASPIRANVLFFWVQHDESRTMAIRGPRRRPFLTAVARLSFLKGLISATVDEGCVNWNPLCWFIELNYIRGICDSVAEWLSRELNTGFEHVFTRLCVAPHATGIFCRGIHANAPIRSSRAVLGQLAVRQRILLSGSSCRAFSPQFKPHVKLWCCCQNQLVLHSGPSVSISHECVFDGTPLCASQVLVEYPHESVHVRNLVGMLYP
ncbi:hypothetical protein B0H14DRAFT_2658801, partial [Mycena olivaceomarginata]